MEKLWMLSDILYEKVHKCPVLKRYFIAKMTSSCYSTMMREILYQIADDRLSGESRVWIQKTHSHMKIEKHEFIIFVNLFMESVDDLGMSLEDKQRIHKCLLSLQPLFVFNQHDTVKTAFQKIDELRREMANLQHSEKVQEYLQLAQNELANM